LQAFTRANPGFVYDYQLVDVPDGPDGRGESEPVPHFFQNLGEAEYLVSVYQYMRCFPCENPVHHSCPAPLCRASDIRRKPFVV